MASLTAFGKRSPFLMMRAQTRQLLARMYAPLIRSEADAVFGSPLMRTGGGPRSGMPLYEYIGSRILTLNRMLAVLTTVFRAKSNHPAWNRRI